MIEQALEHAEKLWPEVLGGGVAYMLHNLFHGFYHRIGHIAVRLVRRGRH